MNTSEVNTPAVPSSGTSDGALGLSEATRNLLFRMGVSKTLSKNHALAPFKSPPEELVFVNKGWLSISFGETVVSLLKPGDVFMGPIHPFAAGLGAPLVLTAVTKAEVVVVSRQLLVNSMSDRPELLFELYTQACARMTEGYIDRCLKQNALPEDRLAAFLWAVGIPRGDKARVLPPIGQAVIASCMGTGREEVSRKRQLLIQKNELSRNEQGDWILSPSIALQENTCICNNRSNVLDPEKSRSE